MTDFDQDWVSQSLMFFGCNRPGLCFDDNYGKLEMASVVPPAQPGNPTEDHHYEAIFKRLLLQYQA